MQPIVPGRYHIFYVDFTGGPDDVVLRPLGLNDDRQVVIMQKDFHGPPAMWDIHPHHDDGGAIIVIDGVPANPAPGGSHIDAFPTPHPPHAWFVVQSAPHPPPVGRDAYSIFMDQNMQKSWSPGPDGNVTDEQTLVHFGDYGFPFFFKRISDY